MRFCLKVYPPLAYLNIFIKGFPLNFGIYFRGKNFIFWESFELWGKYSQEWRLWWIRTIMLQWPAWIRVQPSMLLILTCCLNVSRKWVCLNIFWDFWALSRNKDYVTLRYTTIANSTMNQMKELYQVQYLDQFYLVFSWAHFLKMKTYSVMPMIVILWREVKIKM